MPEHAENDVIPEVLAAHRWTKFSRCECGWTVRPCIFPEPQVGGLVQFEAHVAMKLRAALTETVAEAMYDSASQATGDEWLMWTHLQSEPREYWLTQARVYIDPRPTAGGEGRG